MSVDAPARRTAPRALAHRYRRLRAAPGALVYRYRELRTAHPVAVLGWLRNGVLVCVLAAALAYVWVATQAGNDISTASRTPQAIKDIGDAAKAAKSADAALVNVFKSEDVSLTGLGAGFIADISEVSKNLVLAAEGNAAGKKGTSDIQFAQNQLQEYQKLSLDAVNDYGSVTGGPVLGMAAGGYASSVNNDLVKALSDLSRTEMTGFAAQRGAWPLDPGTFWWLLLAPVIVMILAIMATAQVLAGHFRRHVSWWLWASLLVTAATVVIVGGFNASDAAELAADPWAGHPATMTIALAMFSLAAACAYLAYRPRLAEYRFESR